MSALRLRILVAVLLCALGVAAVVAGESDDSPGLQLLGALLALGAVAWVVRTARRRPTDHVGSDDREMRAHRRPGTAEDVGGSSH